MSALIVDDVMLREPRLLMPGMQPVGNVKLNPDHPFAKKYFGDTAKAWVINGFHGFKNLARSGPIHDLKCLNDEPTDTQVPFFRSSCVGIGAGYIDASSVYNGGAYVSVGTFPFKIVFNKTWHVYLNTKNRKGSLAAFIKENSYNLLGWSGSNVTARIANKLFTFSSATSLPEELIISCVAWNVGATQYVRLFMNGVFKEEMSSSKDEQGDFGQVILGADEYVINNPANTYSTNFFYGPIYFAYSGRDEVWSDSDVLSLHNNIYQFLIPA